MSSNKQMRNEAVKRAERKRQDRRAFWAGVCAVILVLALLLSLLPVFVNGEGRSSTPLPQTETGNNSGGGGEPPKTGNDSNKSDGDQPAAPVASTSTDDFEISLTCTDNMFYRTLTAFDLVFQPSTKWLNDFPEGVDGKKLNIIEVEMNVDASSPFEINKTRFLGQRLSPEGLFFVATGKPPIDGRERERDQWLSYLFGGLVVKKDVPEGYQTLNFTIRYNETIDGKTTYKETQISLYVYFHADKSTHIDKAAKLIAQDNGIPKLLPGGTAPLTLNLINRGTAPVKVLNVTPQIAGEGTAFPFVLTHSDYSAAVDQVLMPMQGNNTPSLEDRTLVQVNYGTLQVRQDIKKGYQAVTFQVDYVLEGNGAVQNATVSLYFDCQGKEEVGDDGKPKPGSKPRLMVKGFTTTPAEIMGGKPFTLHLQLVNTSQTTAVSNIRLSLSGSGEDQVFLPASGSSAVFVPLIGAGQTKTVDVPMTASAKAEAKTYPLAISLDFEGAEHEALQGTESISLSLKQEDRLDTGKIEIMPEQLNVGSDANIIFPLFNKGRTTLYNVSVLVPEGQAISGSETYIGNMEPGSNKSVDMMVHGDQPFMEEQGLKLTIRYEDENGKPTTRDLPLKLIVQEAPTEMPGGPGGPMDPGMMPPEAEGTPWYLAWWFFTALGLGLVLIIVVIVLLVRKRRKARLAAQLADDDDDGYYY